MSTGALPGPMPWPYPIEYDRTDWQDCDVLVIGGGASGCFAAMGAASRGARVIMWEKAATMTSGAMGSGCDHWEMAATNPCSKVSPEELADAMVRMHHGYNNGISHYIESREGWDRLLDLEKYGAKIRDTDDEFAGADFRDPATKLMFAYDYVNRFTLRVWGTTFKRAMYRGAKILKAQVIDRTMGAGLLTEGGRTGGRVVGAVALNGRTGRFTVCRARSVVFCMSRPTRLWLFAPGATGISEFRPPQCTGDGHAMAWRVGGQFTMLEKSLRGEWSGLRSFPPYSTGNNHNTWYACTMVDATGRKIPWLDRDGNELPTVADRYPTLIASAPALISSIAASEEATLPAINSISGNFCLTDLTIAITPLEWPCAVSTASTSTPASTSAAARSRESLATPSAAPTRNRPCESLQALGYIFFF